MSIPRKLHGLVKKFSDNFEDYKSIEYSEAKLRIDFLNPFFEECLNWDIPNRKRLPERLREVITEDRVRQDGRLTAPDYSFGLNGDRKFFVEAKRPSVSLDKDKQPAIQLRSYGWTAGLPISILTDFEEISIYDCRPKPNGPDEPKIARVKYIKYHEIIDNWDWFAERFHRDSVEGGSLDKYIKELPQQRGIQSFDAAFLIELENWRSVLAQDIAIHNPRISQSELNDSVQRTIDRIIFLRIAESRGIEEYGRLDALCERKNVYSGLVDLYREADARYNSGLFHFRNEKAQAESPDTLTPNLNISNEVLKKIVKGLYYPKSPYAFEVVPASILGQIYEQFLGKVITLDSHHNATVELKPEVRKAGGVYYTPEYIAQYIVENTIGQLLKGKTPSDVAKMRFLDPACGSGSFLLVAYSYLLDWHLRWYIENKSQQRAKNNTQAIYAIKINETINGVKKTSTIWHLTTAEKKRILLNNIYGVDIDRQAVEVTKLSLLLKMLEGENRLTFHSQTQLKSERVLPDLAKNIKCGNSLIGSDFFDILGNRMLDIETQQRINAFDWNYEFREIMNKGGFDAIIGNPPYIPIETLSMAEREYFNRQFQQLERKYDSSVVFILASLDKLSTSGLMGFISSITWQTGENYSNVRKYLFTQAGVVKLINLPFNVFKGAYVDTGVYILSRKPSKSYAYFQYPKKFEINTMENLSYKMIGTELVAPPMYKLVFEPLAQAILKRAIEDPMFKLLGDFTQSTQGLAGNRFTQHDRCRSSEWYPYLVKGQAHRYSLTVDEFAYANMEEFVSLKRFYEARPKLLPRRVISRQDRLLVAYTDKQMVFKKDINPFIPTDEQWDIFYLLAVLNSKLISYLYVNTSSIATKDDFRQTTLAELRRLPIPTPEFAGKKVRQLSEMAVQMLTLHKQLSQAKTPHEKDFLQRQIDQIDWKIDLLIYELYNLTDDEIAIIEGGVQPVLNGKAHTNGHAKTDSKKKSKKAIVDI